MVTFSRPKPFHCPNSKIEFYWLFASVPESRACLTTSVSLPMLSDLLLFLPELVEVLEESPSTPPFPIRDSGSP